MNKKFFLSIALITLTAVAFSQPMGGGSMKWSPDGNSYTAIEKSKIVRVELPSMNKTALVDADKLFPKDSLNPNIINDFQWSANQEKILLFVNTETIYHKTTGEVWLYDLKTGGLKQLGKSLRKDGLMYAKFSPDGSNIAYVYQDKSKSKVVYNLYAENPVTGKIKQLTFDTRDRCINGTFDWVYAEELFCRDGFRWCPDGKSIAYWNIDASRVRNYLMLNTTDSTYSFTVPVEYPKAGEDPSPAKIGVVDLATARTIWMKIEGDPRQNYLVRMEWAGGHELVIQQLNRKQNKTNILLADAKTATCRLLWTESDAAWIDVKAAWNGGDNLGWDWIENRKAFIWASEKDGWRHLYRIGMDGKETLITKGDFDVMRLYLIDEKNNTLYFAASPDNYTQRYLYRTSLDGSGIPERITSAALPGTHNYVMSPNGKWARHSFSSHLYLPASEWIDLRDMKPLDENAALAKNLKEDPYGKQIEYFRVTTEDNITLDGWIAKPKDFDPARKYPVLFQVYGEPWSSTVMDVYGIGRNAQFGDDIPDQGYLFVSVDNRGTPSPRGSEWRKSIYRKIGIVNIRDLAMGAKEVLKWSFCDTSRVAVTGWSGGGSSTLNLMFQYPEIYKTGIAVAAVANQLAYDNTYQERYMGIPQENREDFLAGSPYTHARNLRGNLLYIHGTGDDNVHYANAEKLINELIRYNKPFQMMAYPMRSHGIREGEGTREHLRTISSKFLRENCPAGGRLINQSPAASQDPLAVPGTLLSH